VLALLGTWLASPLCYETINRSVILELMFPDRPQDSVGFNSTILISYLIRQYGIINTRVTPNSVRNCVSIRDLETLTTENGCIWYVKICKATAAVE
jgi:hypothetical protein